VELAGNASEKYKNTIFFSFPSFLVFLPKKCGLPGSKVPPVQVKNSLLTS
jgi:hypothetical protein